MYLIELWVLLGLGLALSTASDIQWDVLEREVSQLQSCTARRNVGCVAKQAQTIWKMVPERSTLYYAGVVTGEGTGISVGSSNHWIQDNGYNVRMNPFENRASGSLEVDREVKGLTVLYTGRNETVRVTSLDSYIFPSSRKGESVAFGFSDTVDITDRQVVSDHHIFIDHAKHIKEYASRKMILVDARYWDFKELVKSGDVNLLTGVIEDILVNGERKKIFRTAYSAVLTRSDDRRGYAGHSSGRTEVSCPICDRFLETVF